MSGTRDRSARALSRTLCREPDDLLKPAAALPDQDGHLVPVHQVRGGRRADHDHHVDPGRQVLEQRAHRRNPDPGSEQRNPFAQARMTGERAVGALDSDPGARPQAGRRPALVAETLDGDPDVRRLRQGGQRVRVPLPPQPLVRKCQWKNWPPDTASRSRRAPADHRDDPGRLLADLDDPEPVPQAPPRPAARPGTPAPCPRWPPRSRSKRPDQRMADERGAGEDLVRERHRQPDVGYRWITHQVSYLQPALDLPVGA